MAARTTRPTILIVEDNAVSRDGLVTLLENTGYHAVATTDGRQALNVLRSEAMPHLILLDMIMPIMDGWHFLDQIRADPQWSPVPIVIMTGIVIGLEWAQDHGAAGFVKKPIDELRLFSEIDRCLAGVA
jgi:CheY-like chemotaxis protein